MIWPPRCCGVARHLIAPNRLARAIGVARTGDAVAAAAEAEQLAALQATLAAAGTTCWASEVDVQRIAAASWAAFARGETEAALTSMRDAADREDRQEKHITTPGRILPARELLGDMPKSRRSSERPSQLP